MNSSYKMLILLILISIWSVIAQNNNFIITDFGGIADGKTDNKQALQNAWNKACKTHRGTISIPKGTFFVSGGDFEGPCNGIITFWIDGTLIASSSTVSQDFWLTFSNVNGLIISGTGTLNGNGASTWDHCKRFGNCGYNRPTTLKITKVSNAIIQDVHFVNSKMFHLSIYASQNVHVKKVTILAPGDSPNTDGIHVARSNSVSIMDSTIGTGDDCVSIGDGSRNINITGVFCGPGHGISIGSLGKYKGEQDVSGVIVRSCTLSKTQNGLRIKTWAPSLSSNIVSDVTFANIKLYWVGNPILIDQYYCPSGSCTHSGESSVKIKGVKFIDVRGSSTLAAAVNIQCSKSMPCEDINLSGVGIAFNRKPTVAVCSQPNNVRFLGLNQVPPHC